MRKTLRAPSVSGRACPHGRSLAPRNNAIWLICAAFPTTRAITSTRHRSSDGRSGEEKEASLSACIRIRPALPGEAPLLSGLCVRSKSYWGYDAEFMQQAHRSLQIDPAAIDAGRVFVATHSRGGVLGVADCCALPEPGVFDLLHLFVEPSALRRGVGRKLFAAACAWCVAQGGSRLVILSDPNAAAFYQRQGARLIGEAPSDAVADRILPLFEYRLPRRGDPRGYGM